MKEISKIIKSLKCKFQKKLTKSSKLEYIFLVAIFTSLLMLNILFLISLIHLLVELIK